MTTYVLGAGASRHADYPLAAELGNRLRDWICHNKPADHSWRTKIDELHKLYGSLKDLERILTELDEGAPDSPVATLTPATRVDLGDLREPIREFFDCLREGPAPLYKALADRIRPGDTVITFNYDVSCERELRRARLWEINDGYGFPLGLEAVPFSKVKILKLHGSTNWSRLLFNGTTGSGFSPPSLGTRPVFCPLELDFFEYRLHDPRWPRSATVPVAGPAMIMPILRKRFYAKTSFGLEWVDFWQELWEQASGALQSSDEIVIIGYGFATADEKATELLLERSNREARHTICCGETTAAICHKFRADGFQQVETLKGGRFEDYLDAE